MWQTSIDPGDITNSSHFLEGETTEPGVTEMRQPQQITRTRHKESLCPGVPKFHRPRWHHTKMRKVLKVRPPTGGDRNAPTLAKHTNPTQESLCPSVAKFHRPGRHHKFIVQSLELGPPTRSDRNVSTFGKPHQPDTGNLSVQVWQTFTDPGDITNSLCKS